MSACHLPDNIGVEAKLEQELRRPDRSGSEDRRLPISDYNYSAVRDRLAKADLTVSLTVGARGAGGSPTGRGD